MEQQKNPVQWYMRYADGCGDGFVDQGRPGLRFEKDSVALKKLWVELLENGGKVNGLIFNAYMVTVDGNCAGGEP